jgi:hypothetical protein
LIVTTPTNWRLRWISPKKLTVPLLVFLLASPFFLNTQTVHAQQEPTLADIINNGGF